MLDKIYDFYIEFEGIIIGIILLFGVFFLSLHVTKWFDEELTREKNIIENTKEYIIFDNCKILDNKYYCWEEEDE